jgi:hypothetical protein
LRELDERAYDIVCNWYKTIEFNPIHKSIDYSQIIRFYLWDKVGRALRIRNNIDYNEVDVYKEDNNVATLYYLPTISNGKYRKALFKKDKIIYSPFIAPDFLISDINQKKGYRIVSNIINNGIDKQSILKPVKINYKDDWHLVLYNAVINSLNQLNIDLIEEDMRLLKEQIEGTCLITNLAESELKKYKPDAIYLYSDNHPPFINYCLVSKKLGIPTFTYQHGLDCEHYFLDDCYADYVAVWSNKRKQDYIERSSFKPKSFEVVGKIGSSDIIKNHKLTQGKSILFVTRPHRPDKCYSPSRNHLEGLHILEAILEFMLKMVDVTLVIKPHPSDYVADYKTLLEERGMINRVLISDKKVMTLASKASVVITEDSTAGVEALQYDLPCVNAHLAKSEPVIPFVKYKSAFPGNSKEEIVDSLHKAFNLSLKERNNIKINQQLLVSHFIPKGESKNLTNFILKNM